MEPRQSMRTLLWSHHRQVLRFIGLLLTHTQSQLQIALALSILNAKVHRRSRWRLQESVIERGIGRFSIDGNHPICRGNPGPMGIAVWINLDNFWLTSQVCRGGESRRSYRYSLGDHMQTHQPENCLLYTSPSPRD